MATATYSQLKSGGSSSSSKLKKAPKGSAYAALKASLGEEGLAKSKSFLAERDKAVKEQEKQSIFEKSLQESVVQTQNQANIQENNQGGFADFLVSSTKNTVRDLFFRGKQDAEYLKEIERNNKTVAELLKAKRENPDKAEKYNLMLDTLVKKNEILSQSTGGNLKNKTTGQLVGQSVGTVVEALPTLGSGITTTGRLAVKGGGEALTKSLLKEGLAFGSIGAGSQILEEQQTKPAEIFGTVASNIILGTVFNLGIGKLGERVADYLAGKKVDFTPKEKDLLEENVPDFSDEDLFRQAGLEPPLTRTDTDLTAKTIAASDDEADIKSILSGKVSDEDADFLSKSLKNITDEDEIASILDEYDPVKVKVNLAEKISMMDNEKRIGSLLKDTVSEADIPRVSKLLKNMENEDEIVKVLDEFEAKKLADDAAKVTEGTAVQTPEVKVDEPPVEKNFIERDMTDSELADALMKKEQSRFKETDSQYQANSKAAGMKYSSIKKRLAGEVTQKELNNARKYLESGYIGKEVKVGGKKGIIKKMIYGDYGIDFGDGKIKKVTIDEIRGKKVTDKQVIQHIIDGAKKELESSANIFKSVSRKISEEVLPKPKVEIPKPKPVEKVKEPVKETKKETPKAKVEEPKSKEEPKKESPKVEEPTPSVRKTPSGLSESTVAKAVKADIMRETIDIPELSTMDVDREAKMSAKILFDDVENAIEIAKGNRNPPNGVRAGSVYIAVRNYALANNDFDLIKELATADKINNFARALGQEIKAFDGSMYSDPVQVMQEVMRLKNEIFKKSGKNPKQEMSEAMAALQKSMDENTSTDEAFEAFIKSKKC